MPDKTYWALLADPDDYGWHHLAEQGAAVWDGIKNARAQNNMKRCAKGDLAMIYHTAPDKAVIGIAKVTGTARPDPNADGRVVIDIAPVRALARPVTLAEMKADPVLAEMSFVRMPRVAVQAVTGEQWERVLVLGEG
jgi:predicted RNA-binding protein with PUA-like domain